MKLRGRIFRLEALSKNQDPGAADNQKPLKPSDWTDEELNMLIDGMETGNLLPELEEKMELTAWPNRTAGMSEEEIKVLLQDLIVDEGTEEDGAQ